MPWFLPVRDVLVLALTASLWWLDRTQQLEGHVRLLVAVAAGAFTGLSGFLAHEYGHLVASLGTGSAVTFPRSAASTLLFHFDSAKNSRRQFMWMSFGGYLATVLTVIGIAVLAPLDAWSGRVALGLAGAGMLVTFVLEVPITLRVWRGAPLPLDAAYRPHS